MVYMNQPYMPEKKTAKNIDELIVEGRKQEELGNYKDTNRIFEEISQLDPDNKEAKNKKEVIRLIIEGYKQEELANDTAASDYFKKVLELEPNNITALSYLGIAQIGHDNNELAKDAIDHAFQLSPKNPLVLTAKALLAETEYDFAGALQFSDEAIDGVKNYNSYMVALVLQSRGHILNSIGDYENASILFEASLEHNPLDTYTMGELGYSRLVMDDFDRAKECFIKVIKSRPLVDPNIFYYLGIASYSSELYDDAVDAFDKALESSPKDANLFCGKAFALINIGKYTEAIRLFDRALKIDKFNAAALFGKSSAGVLARREVRYQEKIQDVQFKLLESSSTVIEYTTKYLTTLLKDFREGLDLVKNMFFIQFLLGVGLIISAIGASLIGQDQEILTVILGVTGGASIIIALLREPPLQLQKNRVDFSQWMMGYFNWYNTFLNTHIFYGVKSTRQEQPKWNDIKTMHDYLYDYTKNTINLMEECCEFKEIPMTIFSKESQVKQQEEPQKDTMTPKESQVK